MATEQAATKQPEGASSSFQISAAQATVAAAALALVSGLIGGAIQAGTAERLDRQKFESELIFKAIDTPDRDKQITNLKFFVQIGFISDRGDKIKNMQTTDYPSQVAVQPTPSTDYSGLQPQLVSMLRTFDGTPPDANVLRTIRAQILDLVRGP